MALGHLLGQVLGHLWGHSGPRSAPRRGPRPRGARSPGRRSATRRRSRSRRRRRPGRRRPGPRAARRRWSRSAGSSRRTGRCSRGCGRGSRSRRRRSSRRGPSAQAVRTRRDDVGPQLEALELGGRADRMGQPRRCRRPSWWRTWRRRRRWRWARRCCRRRSGPDVDLGPPGRPPQGGARGQRHGHVGGGRGLVDGGVEHLGVEPGRRRLARAARPVGSEHDVEVDQTPALELDHLDVGEPERPPAVSRSLIAAGAGHLPVEAEGRALPQPRARARSTGPPRGSRSTRRTAARRRAGRRRRGGAKHAERAPVGADSRLRRGRQGTGRLPERPAAVHRPERRGGQGDEELGVLDHAGVDALAAPDAGGHELPGVGLVEARARRADRRPGGPCTATRRSPSASSPGRAVQGDAAEADRVRAQAGLVDLGQDAPASGRPSSSRPSVVRPRCGPDRRWRRRRGSGCGS